MRSVKMDMPTLDKYVKRTYVKKEENIILPKPREVDIMKPELKKIFRGFKKIDKIKKKKLMLLKKSKKN